MVGLQLCTRECMTSLTLCVRISHANRQPSDDSADFVFYVMDCKELKTTPFSLVSPRLSSPPALVLLPRLASNRLTSQPLSVSTRQEEGGLGDGTRRTTSGGRGGEEEEGLFKADAVNEEDPERGRRRRRRRRKVYSKLTQ